MQKIRLSSVENSESKNGLAIDESLIPDQPTTPAFTVQPSKKEDVMKKTKSMGLLLVAFAIVAGIGTGFGVNAFMGNSPLSSGSDTVTQEGTPTNGISVGEVYGNPNESELKDSAEGVVQIGGIEGEGSHHIVRPGGPSQTVYLTSSSVDLDSFDGAKVKVWGETFSAQKAGWLMDVQRVKVIEINAELPKEK